MDLEIAKVGENVSLDIELGKRDNKGLYSIKRIKNVDSDKLKNDWYIFVTDLLFSSEGNISHLD